MVEAPCSAIFTSNVHLQAHRPLSSSGRKLHYCHEARAVTFVHVLIQIKCMGCNLSGHFTPLCVITLKTILQKKVYWT
jgi:hypothetical protein